MADVDVPVLSPGTKVCDVSVSAHFGLPEDTTYLDLGPCPNFPKAMASSSTLWANSETANLRDGWKGKESAHVYTFWVAAPNAPNLPIPTMPSVVTPATHDILSSDRAARLFPALTTINFEPAGSTSRLLNRPPAKLTYVDPTDTCSYAHDFDAFDRKRKERRQAEPATVPLPSKPLSQVWLRPIEVSLWDPSPRLTYAQEADRTFLDNLDGFLGKRPAT